MVVRNAEERALAAVTEAESLRLEVQALRRTAAEKEKEATAARAEADRAHRDAGARVAEAEAAATKRIRDVEQARSNRMASR